MVSSVSFVPTRLLFPEHHGGYLSVGSRSVWDSVLFKL